MNDFHGLLSTDYRFKKSASSIDDYDSIFATSSSSTSHRNTDAFAKYASTSATRGGDFDFDSMLGSNAPPPPKYDKPVYDDDIFDGVPGLKSSGAVKYDDVFASGKRGGGGAFDDLLGSLSGKRAESERVEKVAVGDEFDDLLPGFGRSSPRIRRQTSEASRSSISTADTSRTAPNMMHDPFVVIGSASPPEVSSPKSCTDPLEETGKFNMPGRAEFDVSSVKGRRGDDMDSLSSLGKSMPVFSSEISDRSKERNFVRRGANTSGRQTLNSKASTDTSSVGSPDNQSERKSHVSSYPDSPQTMPDTPSISNSFSESIGQNGSFPSYVDSGMNSQAHMSPESEDNLESSDNVWLTVSKIPLFTQPTRAPPPSRPPPPRPAKYSKAERDFFSSGNARKTINDFTSVPDSTQYTESSKFSPAARDSFVSPIDQLEDFAMDRSRNSIDEHVDVFSGHEVETNSDAAASAAAMKKVMDRAEAKFRHAKEVKERENAKSGRSREAAFVEKDEKDTDDAQEKSFREREDELKEERRLEEERERTEEVERKREAEEREHRKLERERERERERAREIEREREKARQAVERATREARERASLEARLKAEKAAVEKANAEARQRAERAAVQRAQNEARARAAAEAKERAEKAAAEARERENAEAKERAARAEADARSRAERAAVERASAEARQRAAAEARDRAATAAAAKVNQQKSEDDFDFFFGMGRPISAPKARDNSSDPMFDTQFQASPGPEVARRTSAQTSSSIRKASSTTNITDDLSSIFGAAPSSGDFQEVVGDTDERRRARLQRHQRTQERAAKALDEKNQRDLQVQRDQAERHRISETLDTEIKRWSAGKEGNLRALLSTLQYVLWPECGWQPVSLIDLINAASVKKVYRKATLCIHPDKVQQKGANLHQKYVAEKVFDLLKEAWNKFNSEELF